MLAPMLNGMLAFTVVLLLVAWIADLVVGVMDGGMQRDERRCGTVEASAQ
jgi:hypothetical protein